MLIGDNSERKNCTLGWARKHCNSGFVACVRLIRQGFLSLQELGLSLPLGSGFSFFLYRWIVGIGVRSNRMSTLTFRRGATGVFGIHVHWGCVCSWHSGTTGKRLGQVGLFKWQMWIPGTSQRAKEKGGVRLIFSSGRRGSQGLKEMAQRG